MSVSNLSPRLLKIKTKYLNAFAQQKKVNPYQDHLKESRRRVSLLVPDDGPNGFTLPGGIRPGSRFEMDSETKAILI